ncbi:hypothetical protein PVAND_010252 [Polypedilum vanderplanki]|uniref:G-protein coupled receptors family 1 profile domain-containing protein n=1 Tax=Polypedilum vanderplanki TaxID=319348 RepID=A0A9J6CFP8_POLVA|nr:hypothetical protein PVAND_010252 [Polypedilum vanderplanki]
MEVTYILTTIEIIIAILAGIGNTFVITIFFKDEKLRNRKINSLFVSQAFSDLLVGIIGIPLNILLYLKLANEFCKLTISNIIAVRTVSINNVLLISFDRYKALSHPIKYAAKQSKFSLKISIFSSWFFGLLLGFIICFYNNDKHETECTFKNIITRDYAYFLQFVSSVLPFTTLVVIYSYVYLAMRKVHLNHTCDTCVDLQNSSKTICKIRRREFHATVNMLAIVASFAICKFPLLILHLTYEIFYEVEKDKNLQQVFIAINHLTTIINPILYALKLKDFRKSCIEFLSIETENKTSLYNRSQQRNHI